jgi:hypothetical protein
MVRELYFYPESHCYVVRWVADLTKEAMVDHWRDLLGDPDYRPDQAALHDVRNRAIKGEYADTVESRDTYQREVAPKTGSGRVAVLVDNAAAFGSGRQLTVMTGLEEESLVTYSEQEAKRWIGLDAALVLPYELNS